jgi:hypothetical protein
LDLRGSHFGILLRRFCRAAFLLRLAPPSWAAKTPRSRILVHMIMPGVDQSIEYHRDDDGNDDNGDYNDNDDDDDGDDDDSLF